MGSNLCRENGVCQGKNPSHYNHATLLRVVCGTLPICERAESLYDDAVNVSGFESYRSAFDLTWTAVNVPSASEQSVPSEPVAAAVSPDGSDDVLREMASYQFAMRVNDRAFGVLAPIE